MIFISRDGPYIDSAIFFSYIANGIDSVIIYWIIPIGVEDSAMGNL